jgi:hypothetical protein
MSFNTPGGRTRTTGFITSEPVTTPLCWADSLMKTPWDSAEESISTLTWVTIQSTPMTHLVYRGTEEVGLQLWIRRL